MYWCWCSRMMLTTWFFRTVFSASALLSWTFYSVLSFCSWHWTASLFLMWWPHWWLLAASWQWLLTRLLSVWPYSCLWWCFAPSGFWGRSKWSFQALCETCKWLWLKDIMRTEIPDKKFAQKKKYRNSKNWKWDNGSIPVCRTEIFFINVHNPDFCCVTGKKIAPVTHLNCFFFDYPEWRIHWTMDCFRKERLLFLFFFFKRCCTWLCSYGY